MDIQVTARHFKAHDTLRDYAVDTVRRLERYYDGIVRCDVILSFERSRNSLKTAEVHLVVHGNVLKAVEKTEDYVKSIDAAVQKIERRLMRYKGKLREKDQGTVRKAHDKV